MTRHYIYPVGCIRKILLWLYTGIWSLEIIIVIKKRNYYLLIINNIWGPRDINPIIHYNSL